MTTTGSARAIDPLVLEAVTGGETKTLPVGAGVVIGGLAGWAGSVGGLLKLGLLETGSRHLGRVNTVLVTAGTLGTAAAAGWGFNKIATFRAP